MTWIQHRSWTVSTTTLLGPCKFEPFYARRNVLREWNQTLLYLSYYIHLRFPKDWVIKHIKMQFRLKKNDSLLIKRLKRNLTSFLNNTMMLFTIFRCMCASTLSIISLPCLTLYSRRKSWRQCLHQNLFHLSMGND